MIVPHSGNGLHDFILNYTAREIYSGRSPEAVQQRTWQLTCDKGRSHSILEKEISDAIDGAVRWLEEHPGAAAKAGYRHFNRPWEWQDSPGSDGIRRPPEWSKWVLPFDERLRTRILSRPFKGKLQPRNNLVLADLYGNYDFILCLAPEVNQLKARSLSYWQSHLKNLEEIQWIVPNPCLRVGDGGDVKTDRNAGERIWLIIEFDYGTLEEQTKLLFWLERAHAEWDLAMIVYSGGKSLHGWFSCVGMAEHLEIVRFFRVATSLGCDRMMRSSVQYTRFPLGINRKTKRMQEIKHWNDEVIALHCEKLKRRLEWEDE